MKAEEPGAPIAGLALMLALALALLAAPAAPVANTELQARVDRLLESVDTAPTDPDNVLERAHLVWEWANAVALERGFIPLNTTSVLNRLLNPRPPRDRPTRAQARQLDNYIRQLALIDDPGRLGELSIEGPPAAQILSHQTYRVTYTVGELPVRTSGRFLVARQFMSGLSMQIDDPSAAGYVSISSSRSGARFEKTTSPVAGPHGGFRAPVDLPAFRLVGAELSAGDRVTITYGDTSGGGPGMRVGEFSNDAVALPVYVDHGDGVFHEFPPPTFRVVGGPAAGVQGFSHSIAGLGEEVTISVRTEDAYYNRATGPIPAYQVLLDGEPYGDIAAASSELSDDYAGAVHLLGTSFDEPGVYRFTFRSADGEIQGRSNPILVERDPTKRIYWGETHGHSGFAEGLGTVDGYFRFGRDDARLDFITMSEHDIWMDDREWQVLNEAVGEWSKDGEYIVYPGYEWSSPRALGGHHNVFFRSAGFDRVPVQQAPVLSALYRGLHDRYDPSDVLVIPHAHQAGDWRLSDLSTERLVELVSGHGTFEWFGRYYLENGYQVGFIGASDDHIGHPGYAPGRTYGERRSNIFQFGSLAGVFADAKTHDSIFDGLRARNAYAASGAERIILQATLNDQPMGTSMPDTEERRLELRAIGTAPIEEVTVVRNGEEVLTEQFASAAGSARDGRYQIAFESDSQPFIRDNPRGHRIWSGELSIEGGTIESAEITGKANPSGDFVRVEDGDVAFDLATRGLRRTFDLVLNEVTPSARISIVLRPGQEQGRAPTQVRPSATIPGAVLGFDLTELAGGDAVRELTVGRYTDSLRFRRLRANLQDDITLEWIDTDPGPGGDWYYLRVRQIDGATAWSSPWWIGTEPPR